MDLQFVITFGFSCVLNQIHVISRNLLANLISVLIKVISTLRELHMTVALLSDAISDTLSSVYS